MCCNRYLIPSGIEVLLVKELLMEEAVNESGPLTVVVTWMVMPVLVRILRSWLEKNS